MCKACKVDGCNNKHYCKGYCSKHYTQIKRHGEIIEKTEYSTCTAPNCTCKTVSKYNPYCSRHDRQFKKYGYIPERTRFDANEIIEYDDYAEIIIYNNQCEEIARTIIDLDDIDRCKQYKWCLNHDYVVCRKINLFLHQFIMNPPKGMTIDHINGDKLDNRKSNLRICTMQQNSFNKGVQTNNTSGTTGVFWDKSKNRWVALIQINRKQIYLGTFKEKEDAIQARKQAEIDYFGEYRRQE